MKKSQTYRLRLVLVVALPCMAILLSAGVVVGPYLSEKTDYEKRIAKAGTNVVTGMCADSALRLFSQHEAKEIVELKSWEFKRIPIEESDRERFELFHLYERLAQVKIVSSKSQLFHSMPSDTNASEENDASPFLPYPEIRTKLIVRGEFENLVDFLSDIASCQRLILIDRIKMTSDSSGGLILQLGIRLALQRVGNLPLQSTQHPEEAR